jgi:hypothetical protein
MYPTLRTIHLLCGAFALPMLLMYAVSAIQMAHTKWFVMKPVTFDSTIQVQTSFSDGRLLARHIMEKQNVRGQIMSVKATPSGFDVRITVPGKVHEIKYDRAAGVATLRTSVAGFMGMLNRLHHAAGLWHEYVPLRIWAILVGAVSFATLGLATTGIWMWWLRKQERATGLILLGANLAFSIVILALLRSNGP